MMCSEKWSSGHGDNISLWMGRKKEYGGMSKDKERFGCEGIKKVLPEWLDFLSET